MKWSTKVGTVARIDVYIHSTFLILVAWVGFVHWQEGRSVMAALAGIAFVLALFLCVLLHEFGHALMARRFGIHTRDITLLPIGGLAQLERMPEEPREELLVALAGPAVNVVIAAGLFVVWVVSADGRPVILGLEDAGLVERLMLVNVVLVLFNLLPAFPMDGGRVLRALLALRMPYPRATQVAATVGQGMALFFGFVGLFFNPFLIFIALFVWIGAGQEAAHTEMRSALGGVRISHAMLTDFRTLSPEDSLGRAVDLLLAGTQHDFPVVDEAGQVVGVLTRGDLLTALARQQQQAPVGGVMRDDVRVAAPTDALDDVLQDLQARTCHTVPVVRDGRLVGLLTMDNVGEFLSVQAALAGHRRPAMPPL